MFMFIHNVELKSITEKIFENDSTPNIEVLNVSTYPLISETFNFSPNTKGIRVSALIDVIMVILIIITWPITVEISIVIFIFLIVDAIVLIK